MGQVAMVRNGLRKSVEDLRRVREELLGLRAAIQIPPAESSLADQDAEPDPLTEMMAVLDCGMHDGLDPLIRDLGAAAEYQSDR